MKIALAVLEQVQRDRLWGEDVVRALELNEDAILSRQARSEGETHTF